MTSSPIQGLLKKNLDGRFPTLKKFITNGKTSCSGRKVLLQVRRSTFFLEVPFEQTTICLGFLAVVSAAFGL